MNKRNESESPCSYCYQSVKLNPIKWELKGNKRGTSRNEREIWVVRDNRSPANKKPKFPVCEGRMSNKKKDSPVCTAENQGIYDYVKSLEREAKKRRQDKLCFTYRKALRSISKFPLKIANGKEAQMLEGIGPFLSKKIDEYLRQTSSTCDSTLQSNTNNTKTVSKKKNKHVFIAGEESDGEASSKSESDEDYESNRDIPLRLQGSSYGVENNRDGEEKNKKTNSKYTPKYRSPPWALLISMYRYHKEKEDRNEIRIRQKPTKQELIEMCSYLTDTPMLPQNLGSFRSKFNYYGWSCMKKTLIEKNLVEICKFKPYRFSLTKSGRSLAKLLYKSAKQLSKDLFTNDKFGVSESEEDDCSNETIQSVVHNSSISNDESSSNSDVDVLSEESDEEIEKHQEFRQAVLNSNPESISNGMTHKSPLQNNSSACYYNSKEIEVKSKDEAKVKIDISMGGLCFAVKIIILNTNKNLDYLEQKQNVHLERIVEDVPSKEYCTIFGWISDEKCPNHTDELERKLFGSLPDVNIANKRKQNVVTTTTTTLDIPELKLKRQRIEYSNELDSQMRLDFNNYKKQINKDPNNEKSTKKANRTDGIFEVILLVDSRERYRNNDRSYLLDCLKRKGVNCRMKSLGLGDMIWVVHFKDSRNTQNEEDFENNCFVLNFIMERKIIDDLASSIIDGRYKEQRFRLKQSGISNIFYLVEGQDMNHQFRLPTQHLETALINLFVNDGFFLKRTPSIDSTIEYLCSFTSLITKLVAIDGVDSYLLQTGVGNGSSLTTLTSDTGMRHRNRITLHHFNQTFAKNKNLTVSQVFGRQLCVINGCSAQIAECILKHYPTPKSLYSAIHQVDSEDNVDHDFLSNIYIKSDVLGIPTRKIGQSLSKFIYKLYDLAKY